MIKKKKKKKTYKHSLHFLNKISFNVFRLFPHCCRVHTHLFTIPHIVRRAVRRKANLEEPDEEKPTCPKKAKNVPILWLFSGETGFSSSELRNWLFFVPRDELCTQYYSSSPQTFQTYRAWSKDPPASRNADSLRTPHPMTLSPGQINGDFR